MKPDDDQTDSSKDDILSYLDPDVLDQNATLQSLDRISTQLDELHRHRNDINSILDLGCGFGAFAAGLGEYLDADTVVGVDLDEQLLDRAKSHGLQTFTCDLNHEQLPLDDDSADLILSFGLIEHLCYYDNCFEETTRVLAPDGFLWLSTPNLGGWINRFALLTGHQPRNVELTRKRAVGTLPVYDPDEFIGHVHAPTYKALLELLELYGFDIHQTAGLRPYQRSSLVKVLDAVFGLRTGWARRVAVLAQYSETETH